MADEYLEPILGETAGGFFRIPTIPVVIFHIFVAMLHLVIAVFMTWDSPADQYCRPFFIMMYLRVAFWFISYILKHIVKYYHDRHRLRGYHSLYRSTKRIVEVPLDLVSVWTVVLMFVQTLMQHYYGDQFSEHCRMDPNGNVNSPQNYYLIFSSVEFMVLYGVFVSYIKTIKQFHAESPPPDALAENAGSVGFTQQGATLVDLLEKQADLIDFYKNLLARMYGLVNGRSFFRVTQVSNDEEENQE